MEARLATLKGEAASLEGRVVHRYRLTISRLEKEKEEMAGNLTLKDTQLAEVRKKNERLSLLYERLSLLYEEEKHQTGILKEHITAGGRKIRALQRQVETLQQSLQQERKAEIQFKEKLADLTEKLAISTKELQKLQQQEGEGLTPTTCEAAARGPLLTPSCSESCPEEMLDQVLVRVSEHNEISVVGHGGETPLVQVIPLRDSCSTSPQPLSDPKWEKKLRPHFNDVLEVLYLNKLLPCLFSNELIDQDEYRQLSNENESEKKRAERHFDEERTRVF